MNKERIALQEILDLCDNENKTHEAIWGIAYEVLSTDVTEPRMFSEEDICKEPLPITFLKWLHKEGYKTNGWDDSMLNTIYKKFQYPSSKEEEVIGNELKSEYAYLPTKKGNEEVKHIEEVGEIQFPFDCKKSYEEDFSHENGQYQNRCFLCTHYFLGHKRRVMCKECFNKVESHPSIELQPKEGNEEVNSSVYDFPNQKICFKACEQSAVESGNCQCHNQRPFEKFSLLPKSSNPIATDHTTFSPNQTEADKEADWEQFIIDQINQSYNEHKGSNEAVQDAAYYITNKIELNLSLARKQVIEEVEEWVNQSLSDARHLGMYDKGIEQLEILSTKLSQLKITK